MSRNKYLFWTVLILLLATFIRVHRLQEVPLSLSHDEAINAIDALDLVREGNPQIFYFENNGREPLHIYIQSAAMALLGTSSWVLFFTSVVMSLLTISLVGLFTRTMLLRFLAKDQAMRASLLAMFTMAVLFWSVMFSRLALRAIFLLPLLILTLYFFMQGIHLRKGRYFLLSGLFLGLSTYTYLPARLIPIILITLVLCFLATAGLFEKDQQLKRRLYAVKGLLLTGVVSLIVFLPLGIYFWQHPDAFLMRADQVVLTNVAQTLNTSPIQLFATNLIKNFRLFVDIGDYRVLYNVPNRPTLHPIMAVCFWIGLFVTLKHWKQVDSQLIVLWLVVMLLPSVLSESEPNSIRAIGALPVVCILIGLGLAVIWNWISQIALRFLSPSITKVVRVVAILSLTVFSIFVMYSSYFNEWTAESLNHKIRGWTETAVIDRFLDESPQHQFLISGELFHPTMRYHTKRVYSDISKSSANELFNDEQVSLFARSEECRIKRNMFWFDHLSEDSAQLSIIHPAEITRYGWQITESANFLHDNFGHEVAKIIPIGELTNEELSSQAYSVIGTTFDSDICLLIYESAQRVVKPGEDLHFQLDWEILESEHQSVIAELVLVSTDLQPVGPEKRIVLDVSEPLGELVRSEIDYPIPDNLPDGKYLFRVSLFEPNDGAALVVYDDSNQYLLGDYAYGGNVTLMDQASPMMPLDEDSNLIWKNETDILKLLASDIVVNGNSLEVAALWETVDHTPYSNYTNFVHILDSEDQLVAQSDSQPQEGRMPTNMWLLGEKVLDQRSIDITSLPSGEYQVMVGWYIWDTGERLRLANNQKDAAELATFTR